MLTSRSAISRPDPVILFATSGVPATSGISSEEIIGAVHRRKAPMMHASTQLEL